MLSWCDDKELVRVYRESIALDSVLMQVVFKTASSPSITEAFSLLSFLSDQHLYQIALCYLLIDLDGFDFLLESCTSGTLLHFKVNKDLSLRQMLGNEKFTEVTVQVANLIQDSDPKLSLLLLDKIKDVREVLKVMIKMLG